jgi:hypothetical protein
MAVVLPLPAATPAAIEAVDPKIAHAKLDSTKIHMQVLHSDKSPTASNNQKENLFSV